LSVCCFVWRNKIKYIKYVKYMFSLPNLRGAIFIAKNQLQCSYENLINHYGTGTGKD
jgi:hypothetical protein